MPSISDIQRTFFIQALGLPENTTMTVQDLMISYYQNSPGQFGAGRYRITPQLLPKWMRAKARVRDGVANAKILMIGDSTFFGSGSSQSGTFPSNGAPSTRLATLLNNGGITALPGLITPGVDQRWTIPGNWTGTLFGFGSLACYTSAVNAGALVCTDSRIAWDRCDIYYLQGPGLGTVACTATGGSVVNGVGANGVSTIAKVTASAASASTSNTISIVPTVGQCYVVGVEFYISTGARLYVGNGGVGTTGAQHHTAPSQVSTWGTIPCMNAYQPDLTIIGLGINDRGNSRTVSQYKTDMQTLITAAKAVSDVILCTQMPSGTTPQSTNEAGFNSVVAELSASNNVGYYDYYSRCVSFNSYNSRGMAADFVHQNNLGYWDWAEGLSTALLGV